VSGLDILIAPLARDQHGCFNHDQVTDLGATKRQISRRIRSGLWMNLDRGVYALTASPPTWRRQVMAATLSRSQAIASGPTAAVLHGLPGFRPGRPELTIPALRSHNSSLATIHRRADYQGISSTTVDRIPVAAVAEALFDISYRTWPRRLQRAIDHALVTELTTIDELHAVLDRIAGSRLKGTVAFREAIRDLGDAYVPTQSETESLLFAALDDPRVPPIDRQVRLSWWEELPHRIDAFVGDWNLILEADGRAYHTKREDFERDRERDNLAAALGYRVMRFTYAMLRDDPERVLQMVLRASRVNLQEPIRSP
jgi:very-short-patch-repair endonuclease